MNTPLPQLQLLLLDLLSPIRTVSRESIADLADEEWAGLLGMARQHRLEPLLHWQLTRVRQELPVPTAIKQALAESFKRATLRALVLQRELVLVHRILAQAQLPHVALKGAYLAFHAYPQPGLRPLRDLDVLVPADRVLDAYQILLAGGLKRIDRYLGSPEAVMQIGKHLPPLRSSSGQVNVELHSRLFDRKTVAEPADPSESPQFWQRRIDRPVAGHALPFASPTDLLLHLIVHAVHDHQFTNGPLLLSDLAYLLDTHAIDWPLFWALAEQGRHTRACLLALKLCERYWGVGSIGWPEVKAADAASAAAQLDLAACLMLRDFDARGDVNLANELARQSSLGSRLEMFLRKVFPAKANIAATYPVSPHSLQVYLWYPVRWWRLATERFPAYLRSRQQVHLKHEIRQLAALERWLAG